MDLKEPKDTMPVQGVGGAQWLVCRFLVPGDSGLIPSRGEKELHPFSCIELFILDGNLI